MARVRWMPPRSFRSTPARSARRGVDGMEDAGAGVAQPFRPRCHVEPFGDAPDLRPPGAVAPIAPAEAGRDRCGSRRLNSGRAAPGGTGAAAVGRWLGACSSARSTPTTPPPRRRSRRVARRGHRRPLARDARPGHGHRPGGGGAAGRRAPPRGTAA
jgi:hypothetical protein